ncbi:unnamed protein product [Microthlaspi erraticum]|uniref:Uncharacterized protein n=1 Tax=Microthlaspi erraticum TaxID=1685480 RepID=A0A6D2HLC2_9BRAS|nr:unnamed protein product [Microthlaspi erraticum]
MNKKKEEKIISLPVTICLTYYTVSQPQLPPRLTTHVAVSGFSMHERLAKAIAAKWISASPRKRNWISVHRCLEASLRKTTGAPTTRGNRPPFSDDNRSFTDITSHP